ncbi:hypothetical protein ACWGCK_10965 [Streptomyces virginiae]
MNGLILAGRSIKGPRLRGRIPALFRRRQNTGRTGLGDHYSRIP